MQRRSLRWIAACAGLWAAAQCAVAVTDSERQAVYREFRELFDARRYEEALPVADRLVAMTIEQYGENDRALANPLTNRGTVYYRMKNYEAARKDYERSLQILEATGGSTDRQLLRPLHGLGAAHFAAGEYVDAATALKRAVDLSRNLDGLFNVGQLQILDPLISSYIALNLVADAEKEQQYALRVAETAYGKSDVRMLKPLDRYGRWLEQIGRYTTARLMHARALTIAEKSGGRGTLLAVNPLLGIARSYRLEFVNGAEEVPTSPDPFGASDMPISSDGSRMNPDGERALRLALNAVEGASTVDHGKRGEVLVELGDWYLSAGAVSKGIEAYREAWKSLSEANAIELLQRPRLLSYRPPPSSSRRSRLGPDESEERYVELRYSVTRDGRTSNVEVVSADASDSAQRAVVSAMKKARFSPRFQNGEPVDTPNMTWRETILVKIKQQTASN